MLKLAQVGTFLLGVAVASSILCISTTPNKRFLCPAAHAYIKLFSQIQYYVLQFLSSTSSEYLREYFTCSPDTSHRCFIKQFRHPAADSYPPVRSARLKLELLVIPLALHQLDLSPKPLKLQVKVLISPLNISDIIQGGISFRGKRRKHQRCAGPQIRC